MPAIITSATRVHSAISFIESLDNDNIYLFAGKVDPWENENSPELAANTFSETTKIFKSNVFMKMANSLESTLGLKRYDWVANTVYTPWDDTKDMHFTDNWISANQPFYVFVIDESAGVLKYNVYMCIDNNYGAPSTVKPNSQALSVSEYIDGYKWKFMYSIDDIFIKYINSAFVPCPYNAVNKTAEHLAVETNAIPGTIDKLVIENSGADYSAATAVIEGDGVGATVVLTVHPDGYIESYNVTNSGADYTYANVIISGDGVDAEIRAIISPAAGHGYDSAIQLGASHCLYKGTFLTTEGGLFPTIITYRRVGLIRNPEDNSGAVLTGASYDITDQLSVSNIIGTFLNSQRVIGNISGASAVLYNSIGTIFYITDVNGTFIAGETIFNENDNGIIATIESINNNAQVNNLSGDIIYYENLQAVTRRSGQSEAFIFSIEF